jgi:hypothetical protein
MKVNVKAQTRKLFDGSLTNKALLLFTKGQFEEIKNRKMSIPVTLFRL